MRSIFYIVLLVYSCITTTLLAERLEPDQYSQAYIDSIRMTVAEGVEEIYNINAYMLNDDDEIEIDGHLTESAWLNAERQGELLEKEPYPLIPMSEETEFAILYDAENIYIGVWCWDREPGKIIRQLNPRGQSSPDQLFLFLDTYFDKRTGYKFNVSPTGVQADELRYDDFKRDLNWNGVWYSGGQIDSSGWYAEVKIPFVNLRFRNQREHIFGFNIMRNISKDGSRGQWKPHLPEWDNWTRMSKLGQIKGIHDIKPGRNFEIRPYLLAGASQEAELPRNSDLRTGLDVRFMPTSSITADLTMNPDFAQVDADVLDINLTRYPTRFKELRPFFTERTNVFNTPQDLFYSRRIGASGDILGGAKITGKLNGGIEFGSLISQTGDSFLSTGSRAGDPSEKATFGVLRVKKDLLGSSSIGVIYTDKESSDRFTRILGADGSFVIKDLYLLDLQVATAFQADQRSMNYYSSLDRTGDAFAFQLLFNHIDPDFEINEIGYLRKEADRGKTLASGNFRVGPRLNRHGLRRISLVSGIDHRRDLFLETYMANWAMENPTIPLHRDFGQTGADGNILYTGGNRSAENWSFSEQIIIDLMNEMSFRATWEKFQQTELTGSFDGTGWQTTYLTRPMSKGTRVSARLYANGSTFYNFSRKYVGEISSVGITSDARVLYNVLTELQAQYTKTRDPWNKLDGRYWRFSSYTTWMFTKDLYVRLHFQGQFANTFYESEEEDNQYFVSALASWEYTAGSYLYLAFNERRNDEITPFAEQRFGFQDRTLLFKWSYRFGL